MESKAFLGEVLCAVYVLLGISVKNLAYSKHCNYAVFQT